MRIVLKFGSGILANEKGTTLDEEQFALTTERGPRVLMLFSQTK